MPQPRSVKIDQDERGGWSSDRPRREGEGGRPPREVDVSVRGRVLSPTDRLRYMPGSTVVIVSGSQGAREAFAERVVEDKGAIISLDRIRKLIQGRVPDEELDAKAAQLLDATIAKRLGANQGVILLSDGRPEERNRVVKLAHAARSPRHLVLIEAPKSELADESVEALNDLRRGFESGGLGAEGFHTALRLGGGTIAELKRLVFRPPPEDE